jgi:hypothetical protein
MLPLADAAVPPVTIVRCVGPVNEPVASRANRSIAIAVGETFLVATPLERIPTVADPSVVEIGTSYADDARTFWILHARAAGDTGVTFDESNRKRSQVRVQVKVSAAPERAC